MPESIRRQSRLSAKPRNPAPEKPIEQYIAEQRVKHGYPDVWPLTGSAKEITPGVFVDSE